MSQLVPFVTIADSSGPAWVSFLCSAGLSLCLSWFPVLLLAMDCWGELLQQNCISRVVKKHTSRLGRCSRVVVDPCIITVA